MNVDFTHWLFGRLSGSERVWSAIAPALFLLLYFALAAIAYGVRRVLRGPFHDEEMDQRGLGGLTTRGLRHFFAWTMRPFWTLLARVRFPPNAITSLSFAIAFVNAAIFTAIRYRGAGRVAAVAAVLAVVAIPWFYGSSRVREIESPPSDGDDSSWPVLLVQQNTGNDKWDPNRRAEVIHNLVSLTLDQVKDAPPGTLVIWPETATPTFNPPARSYLLPQAVSLSAATSGARIYYTTNGSTPTTAPALK